MKTSTKASLFSAIVFPGAGYFLVQRKARGAVALIIALAGLSMLMVEAYYKAQIIAEKIVRGAIPFDIQIIREQILLVPGNLTPEITTYISLMIGAVWLFSIVDCYRLGLSSGIEKSGKPVTK